MSDTPKMTCWSCQNSNWHIFPHDFTGWTERQLAVCKDCGSMAYLVDPAEEEKTRDYYRKEYRGQIGPSNLLTTTRKLNYVRVFIEPWLLEQEKAGKKLITGDVGAATGYLVNFFRTRDHKSTGSEWTIAMRRFAEHFYGIPITEELTDKHRYDLITMYHTFEHMIEPDKKLAKYVSYLADGGHMLIATPQWLNVLDESGVGRVTTFKELFHKDHINVFTESSIKRVFANAGLIIVKEDHLTYGQTYLLRKSKPGEAIEVVPPEDYLEVIAKLEKQKQAIDIFRQAAEQQKENLYREALNLWPKFPDAYYDWVLNSTVKKDRGRCAELIEESMKIMPGYPKMHIMRAFFLYQNQDWKAALQDFEYLSKTKVNAEIEMFQGYCLYHLGRFRDAMGCFHEASILDPMKWGESMVWMCKTATEQKSWDEVATEKFKDKLFNEAKVRIEPQDPVFSTGNGHQSAEKPQEVA